MAQVIKVSGINLEINMGLGYKHGQTVPDMKVFGKTTKFMARVSSIIFLAINLMGAGRKTWLMDLELICIKMEHRIKENGNTIFSTVLVSKPKKMGLNTKANTIKAKNMD